MANKRKNKHSTMTTNFRRRRWKKLILNLLQYTILSKMSIFNHNDNKIIKHTKKASHMCRKKKKTANRKCTWRGKNFGFSRQNSLNLPP